MVRRLWNTAVVRAGALALDELPDADLLARFRTARDQSAFTAVVRRHGPLVWGVCRRLLPAEADADDAFQATFLALVRGAGRIRRPNALGAWLHGVAGRVCRTSLRAKARRDRHERSAAIPEANDPVAADAWDRWQAAVHEEVDRLPGPLRTAFVLCVLQGVRQPDAAKRLGWKLGSVSGRVCQAKKRLVAALDRRGLAGAAGVAALVGGEPVSAGLTGRAVAVVAGPVPQVIHQLARGATGGFMKAKLLAAGLLVAGLAVGTSLVPTAGGQVPGGPPPAGSGLLPGSGGPPPGLGAPPGSGTEPAPGIGLPGGYPSPGGMPMMGSPVAKVEYKFVAHPKAVTLPEGATAFKNLLTKLGADGWEYAGQVPMDSGELIFKRTAKKAPDPYPFPGPPGTTMFPPLPGSGSQKAAGMTIPTAETTKFPPLPGSGTPGLSGPPGLPGPRPGGSSRLPLVGPPPVSPPAGTLSPAPMLIVPPVQEGTPDPYKAVKPPAVIELAAGETIRHGMATGAAIARLKVKQGTKSVADVTPDPTDAKRVLIAAGLPGETTLDLTDVFGVKETYTIRVK